MGILLWMIQSHHSIYVQTPRQSLTFRSSTNVWYTVLICLVPHTSQPVDLTKIKITDEELNILISLLCHFCLLLLLPLP
jgi:hypothetical protein